jgi:hypothetical protein
MICAAAQHALLVESAAPLARNDRQVHPSQKNSQNITRMRGVNMKTLLLRTVLAVAIAMSGVAIVAAAAPDPVVGTWQLNVSKSTFTSGPALGPGVKEPG